MQITFEVNDCRECPFYELYDFVGFGGLEMHKCTKTGCEIFPIREIPNFCPFKNSRSVINAN